MSDDPIKKRMARAKEKARAHYHDLRYKVFKIDDPVYHFIAIRQTENRLVRVVIDGITPRDVHLVTIDDSPLSCSREVFCQKATKFEIREVRG